MKKKHKIDILSENFTLDEFLDSAVAKINRLENIPSYTHLKNIQKLVINLLQPLRDSWEKHCEIKELGTPSIIITSGYRCPLLNRLVGGATNSAHKIGAAADIIPSNDNLSEFATFVENWIEGRDFDQLILEKCDEHGTPQWLHIGYINKQGKQRKQILRT